MKPAPLLQNPRMKALLEQPYQRFIGVELVTHSEGSCVTRICVSRNIGNLSDTLHGGVLYSVSDTTSMLAALTLLKPGEYALTTAYSASLMSAASMGDEVQFDARVVKFGRTMIFVRCDAFLLASGDTQRTLLSANICKTRLLER